MKKISIIFLLAIVVASLHAQTFPDQGIVFKDNEVPRIDILINPDSLALIYTELEDIYEYHAIFIFHNSLIPHETIHNIGFRLRGGTSLFSQKKSFKVSFNTWIAGQKYDNLEKLNLNGEHNDPGIIRSKLCWNLFKRFGVPAPRASHTQVYINGSYYGLYVNVEHIDDQFVKSRFGDNNGNLYKCLYPADLQYLGSNPNLYKLESGGRRVYELKTNNTADDYSDLAHFIDVLNNCASDSLQLKLDQVFNVQSYLKYLVIEFMTGHWDGYSYNNNNYYLYHNLASNKFEFIPYDTDNTYGIDWMNINWGTRNIYNWASSDPRPLTKRILQNPLYRNEFSFYIKQFLKEYFNTQKMFPEIDSIYTMIYGYASFDPYRSLDYGWNMQNFTDSYTQALGGHVKYGLKPFIGTRYNYAMQQLIIETTPLLYINEFMASNSSTIADEFGEYDDWIEIYNGDSGPVWLGDKYLTDNLNKPDKWKLPQINLNAGSFLLIWADGDSLQGDHHTNFKLSAGGEQIGIFTSLANGSIPIDALTFGAQTTDVPMGLLPNGAGMMQVLQIPTPGASNNINLGIEDHILADGDISVFPNPFHDNFIVRVNHLPASGDFKVLIHDVLGRLVFEREVYKQDGLDGQDIGITPGELRPGMYFISMTLTDHSGRTYTLAGKKLIRN